LVQVPHPVGTLALDSLRSLAETKSDSIISELIQCKDSQRGSSTASTVEQYAELVAVPRDPEEMFGVLSERGWTDGLPILPPTRAAVDNMLAATVFKSDFALGTIPPLNGIATIEKLAANAVMAGGACRNILPLSLPRQRAYYSLDSTSTACRRRPET